MTVAAKSPAAQDEGALLAKAAFRAARALGLSQKDLAATIGVSAASASRMKDGGFALSGKPFELAVCLVRIFRSLDAIMGGDEAAMRSWMGAGNRDLRGTPRQLIRTPAGLVGVMNYLDAQRAPL